MKKSLKHNTKGIETLLKSLGKLSDVEVAVGVFPSAGIHPEAGVHHAALLAMHELSDGSMYPARPVMKLTVEEERSNWGIKINNDIANILVRSKNKKVLTFDKIIKSVESTSREMAEDVQDNFGSPKLAPNTESTIAAKVGSAPLIESGELHDAIKSRVRRKK